MGADNLVHNVASWENGDANLCSQRRMVDCEAEVIRYLDLGYVVIPQTCSTNAMDRSSRDIADGMLVNKMTIGRR